MTTSHYIRAILCFCAIGMGFASGPPEATIANGQVTAKLYLPDSQNGYYRGARFDWSGVIYDLKYKNHHYFGKWFERYEPTIHDAIMGPVDAFDPIGYNESKPGETFLKIGVGWLEKIEEEKYTFSKSYKIVDGGKWSTRKHADNIEFTHEMKAGKYPYAYKKVVSLSKNKPELIIHHKLKNNGKEVIETNVFNHNFFVMDNETTGPGFEVTLTFPPTGEPKGRPEVGHVEGNKIVYTQQLKKGEFFAISPLSGYGTTASDNDIKVENKKLGTAVTIKGDQPIVKFVYWSAPATLCPEPYTKVKVEPGKEVEWVIKYEFFADSQK